RSFSVLYNQRVQTAQSGVSRLHLIFQSVVLAFFVSIMRLELWSKSGTTICQRLSMLWIGKYNYLQLLSGRMKIHGEQHCHFSNCRTVHWRVTLLPCESITGNTAADFR